MIELQDVFDSMSDNIRKKIQNKFDKHILKEKAITVLEHMFIAIVSVLWIGGIIFCIPIGSWLYFHDSFPLAKFCGIFWLVCVFVGYIIGNSGVTNDY
jgi:hypothetical protein